MSDVFHTETIKHGGRDFLVSLHYDRDTGAPWDEHDGHGDIRNVNARGRPEKRPGEVVIYSDRGNYWLYDVHASTVKARREGWGLPANESQGLTKNQIVARAVEKDMEYCASYLNGDWHWAAVDVRIIGAHGAPEGYEFSHAIWGVESTGNYWREVAKELADEILHLKARTWRAALCEAREAKYWATRGVVTA